LKILSYGYRENKGRKLTWYNVVDIQCALKLVWFGNYLHSTRTTHSMKTIRGFENTFIWLYGKWGKEDILVNCCRHTVCSKSGTLIAYLSSIYKDFPVGARFSTPIQTGPRAHPASCTMATRVNRPGCGIDHPLPCSAKVKGRVELYLYFPSGSLWPVLGWTSPFTYMWNLLIVSSNIGFCKLLLQVLSCITWCMFNHFGPVVTVCATYHKSETWHFVTHCIFVFHIILKISNGISLDNINLLILLMGTSVNWSTVCNLKERQSSKC